MKAIAVQTIRDVLMAEKKKLREARARDHEENRARHSVATEDAIARVLMLEELLDPSAVPLVDEGKARTSSRERPASLNDTLDLEG